MKQIGEQSNNLVYWQVLLGSTSGLDSEGKCTMVFATKAHNDILENSRAKMGF